MSAMAILFFAAFGVLALWGITLGIRGCMAESKPFMQGEGSRARFDEHLTKVA